MSKLEVSKPIDATIAFTYKCNSKCQMCNIWQIKNAPDLPTDFLKNLSPDLRYINISGGEISLLKNLPEIVAILKKQCPKAQMIISTNGFSSSFIVETLKKIKAINSKIGVRLSLDGIKQTHDTVRGIPHAYDFVLKTLAGLKEIGLKNLGFSFTVMENNYQDLLPVYELTKKLKIELTIAVVQNSPIYFQKEDNQITNDFQSKVADGLATIVKAELKTWKLKNWLRAYYDYGLIHHLLTKTRLIPSGAGFDSLFIDPLGNIYPSNLIALKMGNLGDGPLEKLWQTDQAKKIRTKIITDHITEPWIICTLRGQMKKNLPKIFAWIIKYRFFKNYDWRS